MTPNKCTKRRGYLVIGAGGLFLAIGYLGMSFQLPFGRLDQPGAAVFPVIVAALVAASSLMTIVEGWRMSADETVDLPAGEGRARLLGLLGLMLGYFLVLPWLGQIVSSILFSAFMIRLLSKLPWPRVLAYAVIMALSLYAFFVLVLKVPMPRGILSF
jgi:putative tricarboxylic transport membrane protein